MTKFLTLLLAATLSFASAASAQDRTVLVELFTSQGCSSCPPADAFLHELAARDDVVAVALHVDYWDYIGWKDIFAQPEFTARQRAYARLGNRKMVYTPQMVINGRDHVVGSNPMDTNELITQHKALPTEVKLAASRTDTTLSVTAQSVMDKGGKASLYLMRYEPKSKVEILRGENAGRTLSYANVVTDMTLLTEWNMEEPLDLTVALDGAQPAVIVVQSNRNGAVRAVAKVE
jgi:hypothetical protein